MRSISTSLALTLLGALLWPLAGAVLLARVLPESRQPLAWALLALVIIVSLIRPLPLIDIVFSIIAAGVYAVADAAQRWSEDGSVRDLPYASLGTVALALLATPWLVRLLTVEIQRLINRVREQAQTVDTLTMREPSGAYRGRFMAALLDEEITRARRYRRSLIVGIVSVDDWQAIVEDQSAERLEEIGRAIEAQLVATVRPNIDKIVALEGGEWALLLPETPLTGATVVAERIQSTVTAGREFVARIGLADFPRDAVTTEGLIAEARHAVTFARSAGLRIVDRTLLSAKGGDVG